MIKKKIATIGGGSGHYTLLSALKDTGHMIYAIVSMADNGGSTGVLRDEYGVLPPGDVRQCLVALSSAEAELRELFAYRYSDGPFKGHSFGNIFLSTLEKSTGSFPEAVKRAGKILQVRGRVLPASLSSSTHLLIKLKDGNELLGESHLDKNPLIRNVGVKEVCLSSKVSANPEAVKALIDADTIILAPGDIWASIMPVILLQEIQDAINKSKAKLIFISNITNKKGISDGFTVCDYVEILSGYIREPDLIIANNAPIPERLEQDYREQEGEGVIVSTCGRLKDKTLSENILSSRGGLLRHDSEKLSKVLLENI